MINLPVLIDIIFTDPVLFPVGSMTIQSSVLDSIELLVFGTVHWAYSPNPALKSIFPSVCLPENITRGLSPEPLTDETW